MRLVCPQAPQLFCVQNGTCPHPCRPCPDSHGTTMCPGSSLPLGCVTPDAPLSHCLLPGLTPQHSDTFLVSPFPVHSLYCGPHFLKHSSDHITLLLKSLKGCPMPLSSPPNNLAWKIKSFRTQPTHLSILSSVPLTVGPWSRHLSCLSMVLGKPKTVSHHVTS